MQSHDPATLFDQKHAAEYDRRFARVAPMRDALHLLIGAVFSELPADARILCVGAGTGSEILYLAEKFPGWRFTAVEPSPSMLDVCRRRTAESGIASRCTCHEGYLDSLPPTDPFDAATSLLVSHFILTREARRGFFRGIADRLRPGGLLANADLASDTASPAYESLLEVWVRLMNETELPREQVERMRETYRRDVAMLPPDEVGELIASTGFETPVRFLQTALIHGWYSRKS